MRKSFFSPFAILLLFVISCRSTGNQKKEETAVLPVITPQLKDTIVEKLYTVNIQARRYVEIRSRLKSILNETMADEGVAVKKGQPLFLLDPQETNISLSGAKAALRSAIADAEAAKVERDRVQRLVTNKVVDPSELSLAEEKFQAMLAKIEEMKAVRENAANKYSYTTIKAPFDGYIDKLPLKPGSFIEEGSLLTTISDLRQVYAYFEIPEAEYLLHARSLNQGEDIWEDTVRLLLTDGTEYPLNGTIQASQSVVDPSTGSIAFRAIFNNPYKILRHNASGTIIVKEPLKNVLVIPQRCVFEIQDKSYVFVVDKQKRVHQKAFVPGMKVGAFIVIENGLSSDEQIV